MERTRTNTTLSNAGRPAAHEAMGNGAVLFAGSLLIGPAVLAQPATGSFGFNGSVSGFPTGAVSITGGGAYDLTSSFVHSGGGFRCLEDVHQGPLSASINPDDPGPCLAGEGVRWDTAGLLTSTKFKCTGAARRPARRPPRLTTRWFSRPISTGPATALTSRLRLR